MAGIHPERLAFDWKDVEHPVKASVQLEHTPRLAIWPHDQISNSDFFDRLDAAVMHQDRVESLMAACRSINQDRIDRLTHECNGGIHGIALVWAECHSRPPSRCQLVRSMRNGSKSASGA